MGLDIVEFIMAVEEAFDLRLPYEDLVVLTTPRRFIDYLSDVLDAATDEVCPSQRVFYRLRSSVVARIGCPHSAIRPDTSLLALIPAKERRTVWDGVRQDVGAARSRYWPRLDRAGWLDWLRAPPICTLREAIPLVIAGLPVVVKRGDKRWTRAEVAAIVHRLICSELGMRPGAYDDDSRWNDMGMD